MTNSAQSKLRGPPDASNYSHAFDFRTAETDFEIWCDTSVTRKPYCLRNSLLHGTLSGKVSLSHKHNLVPSQNHCDLFGSQGWIFNFQDTNSPSKKRPIKSARQSQHLNFNGSSLYFSLRCPRCILKVSGEHRSGLTYGKEI